MNKKGFTLVELITVITIIVLLSLAAVYSFNTYIMKARDADRRANVGIFQVAVEMYYDHEEKYTFEGSGMMIRETGKNLGIGRMNYKGHNYNSNKSILEELKERGFLKEIPVKIFNKVTHFSNSRNAPCQTVKIDDKDLYMYYYNQKDFIKTPGDIEFRYSISTYLDFATLEEKLNTRDNLYNGDLDYGICTRYGRNYGVGGGDYE